MKCDCYLVGRSDFVVRRSLLISSGDQYLRQRSLSFQLLLEHNPLFALWSEHILAICLQSTLEAAACLVSLFWQTFSADRNDSAKQPYRISGRQQWITASPWDIGPFSWPVYPLISMISHQSREISQACMQRPCLSRSMFLRRHTRHLWELFFPYNSPEFIHLHLRCFYILQNDLVDLPAMIWSFWDPTSNVDGLDLRTSAIPRMLIPLVTISNASWTLSSFVRIS